MDRKTLEYLTKKVAAAKEIEMKITLCEREIRDAKTANYILLVHPHNHRSWAIGGTDSSKRIDDPVKAELEALVANMVINWKNDEIALLEAELAEI